MLSMNELTTYRWTLPQDIERYAAAGYEGIGVWRQKLADYGEEDGIDLLAESPLQVTNLLWGRRLHGYRRPVARREHQRRPACRATGRRDEGWLPGSFTPAGGTITSTAMPFGSCEPPSTPCSNWRP